MRGTEYGALKKILRLYRLLIPVTRHSLTCFLDHLMKISRFGLIGMMCDVIILHMNMAQNVCFSTNLVMIYRVFSFELRVRVILSVDGCLSLVSRIRNVNSKPFSFSFAYRTYLSVSDIRCIALYSNLHMPIMFLPTFLFKQLILSCS